MRAVSALAPVWLDAGVSSVSGARQALETGAARVIVGLETLSSFDALSGICNAIGGDRMAFSLDLRDLSRDNWSLLPQVGDFLAEVHTRRFDTLTFARSMTEAEDVTLFHRARRLRGRGRRDVDAAGTGR